MAWLDDYFERIEYQGPTDVSLKTLTDLHIAHAFHIPFENLDIHMGRRISLDPPALIDKLIYQRRGGYCYEMNGLFSLVLETLGFKIDRLFARILFGATELRPRTHQLTLVRLDGRQWLADVGYGTRNLIAPLLFEDGHTEQQYTEQFRVARADDRSFYLQGFVQNQWQNFYVFTLEAYLPVDYKPANHYSSTYPESPFIQRRICTLPTAQGRLVMTNDVLKIATNETTSEIRAETHDHYLELLGSYFGIQLTCDQIAFPASTPVPAA